jgi:hypothetical protein
MIFILASIARTAACVGRSINPMPPCRSTHCNAPTDAHDVISIVAAPLKDRDITDLAAYFAGIPVTLGAPPQ